MSTPARHRVSFHIVWISIALGVFLLFALIICASWMAREIDNAALNEQRSAVSTYLEDARRRIQMDQSTAASRSDGVFYSMHGRYAWVPKGFAQWVSSEFGHDRVYVVYLDGSVLQASAGGEALASEVRTEDRDAVSYVVGQARSILAGSGQTPQQDMCCFDFKRLENGSVAFVSSRLLTSFPTMDPTSGASMLLVSVVVLNDEALATVSQTLGLTGLRMAPSMASATTLALLDDYDRPLAYIQWTPPTPAAKLIQQVALPVLMCFLVVGSCIFFLLAWLRRTSIRLEESETQASFLSQHDTLTGAANRTLFESRMREALAYRTLADTKILLISIDLDRFKEMNDGYGHGVGDEVLREVGRRLLIELPEEATFARLGGDEFAVVQPGIVSSGHAQWICQRLVAALSEPMVLSGDTVRMTVSIGYSVENPQEISPQELARRADTALYRSKAEGRNRYTLYRPIMDADRKERLILQVDLRNAMLQGELFAAYQPIFGAASGDIVGAEALLRWRHPTRGLVSPELFIGVAEETGLIDELGMWVLRRSCELATRIGLPWISVNVSPVQFRRHDLANEILHSLKTTGLAPDRLEIEITEGILLQDSALVQSTLKALRKAGVRIAIDDFGAGYASLSYLRNYEIDKIKIDRSYIQGLDRDETLVHMVRAMVEMGRAMGLTITAEGVEDEAQLNRLVELGCTQLQGFLLSRPISGDELAGMLDQQIRTSTSVRRASGHAVGQP